jgi:hypothetical protein
MSQESVPTTSNSIEEPNSEMAEEVSGSIGEEMQRMS